MLHGQWQCWNLVSFRSGLQQCRQSNLFLNFRPSLSSQEILWPAWFKRIKSPSLRTFHLSLRTVCNSLKGNITSCKSSLTRKTYCTHVLCVFIKTLRSSTYLHSRHSSELLICQFTNTNSRRVRNILIQSSPMILTCWVAIQQITSAVFWTIRWKEIKPNLWLSELLSRQEVGSD